MARKFEAQPRCDIFDETLQTVRTSKFLCLEWLLYDCMTYIVYILLLFVSCRGTDGIITVLLIVNRLSCYDMFQERHPPSLK